MISKLIVVGYQSIELSQMIHDVQNQASVVYREVEQVMQVIRLMFDLN